VLECSTKAERMCAGTSVSEPISAGLVQSAFGWKGGTCIRRMSCRMVGTRY